MKTHQNLNLIEIFAKSKENQIIPSQKLPVRL